jgi:DNA replication protein
MTEFKGFPARMQFTAIPNIVFSTLMPQITDITELKVLLHIFALIYPKKGSLKYVSYSEILRQAVVANDLQVSPAGVLGKALETLTARGVILRLTVNRGDSSEDIFFLNNDYNRQITDKIRRGEISLPGLKSGQPLPVSLPEPLDIFTLYEQNIGMLTPLIADELREAGKQYPEDWIKEAIKEAVSLNKRNWRYIARILEHWSVEGKDDGTHRGNLKTNTDPDKYVKGKYGHMVQR